MVLKDSDVDRIAAMKLPPTQQRSLGQSGPYRGAQSSRFPRGNQTPQANRGSKRPIDQTYYKSSNRKKYVQSSSGSQVQTPAAAPAQAQAQAQPQNQSQVQAQAQGQYQTGTGLNISYSYGPPPANHNSFASSTNSGLGSFAAQSFSFAPSTQLHTGYNFAQNNGVPPPSLHH